MKNCAMATHGTDPIRHIRGLTTIRQPIFELCTLGGVAL